MTQRSTCGLVLQGLSILVSRHFGTIQRSQSKEDDQVR